MEESSSPVRTEKKEKRKKKDSTTTKENVNSNSKTEKKTRKKEKKENTVKTGEIENKSPEQKKSKSKVSDSKKEKKDRRERKSDNATTQTTERKKRVKKKESAIIISDDEMAESKSKPKEKEQEKDQEKKPTKIKEKKKHSEKVDKMDINEGEKEVKLAKKRKKVRKEDNKKNSRAKRETDIIPKEIPEMDVLSELRNSGQANASLCECVQCQNWFPIEDLYFLDMCSHRFCRPCLKTHVFSFLGNKKASNLIKHADCPKCKGLITDNDLTCILSVNEFLDWQEYSYNTLLRLKNAQKEKIKIECSVCAQQNTISHSFTLLPEISSNETRAELINTPADQMISYFDNQLPERTKTKCTKCSSVICFACGRVNDLENGHSVENCTILPAIIISELLCHLESTTQKFSTGSSGASQAVKNRIKTKLSRGGGVGYAGHNNDDYKAIEVAHEREDLQRCEVSQILEILSRILPSPFTYQPHTSIFPLLKKSCLYPLLNNYFRNDWLMDVSAQQSELYFSVIHVVRSLSALPGLVGGIFIVDGSSDTCLYSQLQALNKQVGFFLKQAASFESQEESRITNILGLALDIQNVSNEVENNVAWWKDSRFSEYYLPKPPTPLEEEIIDLTLSPKRDQKQKSKSKKKKEPEKTVKQLPKQSEAEEKYISIMRPLQFAFLDPFPQSLQKITYLPEFAKVLQTPVTSPQVIVRISQELSSLATSLPISINSGIFMRVNENFVNVIRFIIIGPDDTPYSNGCFEFDMVIGEQYPSAPPKVQLLTTGRGTVRFNPNLYNNGKVCLSLLGTWDGPGWDPKVSTLLQVLVSIQSLILVPDPYFNEPGYASQQGSSSGENSSRMYNNDIKYHTIQQAMIAQIKAPTPGFEDVILSHFYLKKGEIIRQCEAWEKQVKTHNITRACQELRTLLNELPPPQVVLDYEVTHNK